MAAALFRMKKEVEGNEPAIGRNDSFLRRQGSPLDQLAYCSMFVSLSAVLDDGIEILVRTQILDYDSVKIVVTSNAPLM